MIGLCVTILLGIFLGCGGGGGGGSTTGSPATPTRTHATTYVNTHTADAVATPDQCRTCHGQDLSGGTSKVNCLTAACHHDPVPGWAAPGTHGLHAKRAPGSAGDGFSSCQVCHGKDFAVAVRSGSGGLRACSNCHGVAAPHPAKPWHDAGGSNHATVDAGNATVCAQCHYPGALANPTGHPATPAPAGTAPGCFNNTMCHGEVTSPHPVPFLGAGHTAISLAGYNGSCTTCHAMSGASPTTTAPLCNACHQAASPFSPTSCTSCHASLPGGTAFPDVAGSHAKHNALTGVTGACSTCHLGSESGTLTHYNHANGRAGKNSLRVAPGEVAFLGAYNGKAGTAAFNPTTLTCSNVSCHGGQTTPVWGTTGSISVMTDCVKCHTVGTAQGLPESNSAYSGFHALHMSSTARLQCTECHAMANGSSGAVNHLTGLGTATLEGAAGGTVAFVGGTYSAAAKTCTVTCHGETHAAYTWGGTGGVHPTGWATNHAASALVGLANCKTCHGTQLTGGPYKEPGCFTAACHHNTVPGYALGASHGLRAKMAQGSTGGGLASCQVCHGTNFASGLLASDGSRKACTSCHGVAAPHPPKPWHNATGSNHATTDVSNAPVCAQCHFPGAPANPAGHPALPAPAGTAPGCYNNTLCHGTVSAPHALGAVWLAATSTAFHGIEAKKDLTYCQSCHGNAGSTGFEGGTAATTKCSSCHTQARAHADRWYQAPGAFPGYVASHRNAGNQAVACALCHDVTKGRTTPDTAAPSCFSATANSVACHANGPGQPNHSIPFLGGLHVSATAATFTSDCATCHSHTGTSPVATAPLCSVCHTLGNPTAAGLGTGTCLSCHVGGAGLPSGPTGAAFPSIAGAHSKHMGLATSLTCNTCHAGSGTGTATHYTNANARTGTPTGPGSVALDTTFNAKGATAAFSPAALTCSSVSCHGGQTTPAWTASGSIISILECTKCHGVAGSAGTVVNFNDAYGRHSLGSHNANILANGIACTTCHNMANGSPAALSHFKYLDTPAVDGVATGLPADQLPSGTIRFDAAIVTGLKTYTVTTNTQGNGGCALTCHSHVHTAAVNDWTSVGVPHPVPFVGGQTDTQGNGHFTTTSTTFTSDCSSCHAHSGTSPVATAPLCSVCHTLGNPTTTGLGTGTCLSCHVGGAGLPSGPTGAAFPSIAGAHSKHMGLATSLTCNTCHAGSGTGTATHYTNANARTGTPTGPGSVALDTTFNAKGATAAFSPAALTCSSVSCHGGQTTPVWTAAGSINAALDCTKCHGVAGSAATVVNFNDAYGRHSLGSHNANILANGIACTTCHNMANGTPGALSHFKYLNTPAVDGVATGLPADQLPSGTIVFDPAIVTGLKSYTVTTNTQGNGGCALTCHSHVHTAAVNDWTSVGTPHPVPFVAGQTDTQGNGHFTTTSTTFTSDCSSCHAHSGTSPVATAPLCSVCHTLGNPTAVGLGTGTCLSCHVGGAGLPNGPTGSGFPSIAGAHGKHMGLATALTCNTCHAGSGTGTTTHYSNANGRTGTPTGPGSVAIDTTFNAKGATSAFSPAALTCSSVSCHGGQTTPAWTASGSINSALDCTKCHGVAGSAATVVNYNDAYGRHSLGSHNANILANGIACTTCHNMANGTPGALSHFKYLNTPAVDGVATGLPADQLPSGTIVFNPAIVTGLKTYTVTTNTQGNGGCALTCHSHVHTAAVNDWTSVGTPHPVPFVAGQTDTQGNGHFTTTSTTFTSDCGSCHAHSGTSPVATAPLCSVCHTLGNPTAAGLGTGTCLSCHVGGAGLPNGPTGGTFPSIAGAHGKHMGLATALTCNTCHAGSGTGTTTHYANANARTGAPTGPGSVAIDATFNAKGATSAFSPAALTCSSVSCHGGQTTPAWTASGSINSALDCTKCHGVAGSAATTVNFNDAYGRHSLGSHNANTLANGIACTTCHNMANGTPGALSHFKYLNTPAVDGVTTGLPADQLPSGTIVFDPAIVTGLKTYTVTTNTQGNGGCALTCHSHVHTAAVNDWTSVGTPHPVPFGTGQTDTQGNGHFTTTSTTFTSDCSSCHAHSGTSPVATAPLCSVCHTLGNPTAVGLGTGTCLSCHVGGAGLPTGPTSGIFPSIAGAHSKHMGLATALTCNTCHAGSGTGTTTHYSNANARTGTPTGPGSVAIDSTYNAKGATATFTPSALTCASVSCHGGQTTPVWTASGSINAALDCTKCHSVSLTAGDPQYNNAFGRHSLGTHAAHTCVTCHNMANGSPGALAHFKYLNTPAVDGVATGLPADQLPSGTIEFDSSVTGAKTYTVTTNTQGNGGCTLTCHTHLHTPTYETWTASGSPHPIPFGAGQIDSQLIEHFQVTPTTFASDCGICHAYTGTSPNASAPLCNVCHSRGNPASDGYGPGTCQSCHEGATGLVGGPSGTSFPSKAGAHSKHLSLATTLYCETCHSNSGTGTSRHYLNADARIAIPVGPATVTVDPAFTAKTGGSIAFTPATLTCSNISCHGGQVTPNWQTGSLNSSTQCTACHATTAQAGTATQYNDAFGRHSMGTHNAVACTTCHTMSNGSLGANAHFKYLNTPAVDGLNPSATPADQLPSGTIVFDPAIASGALTYSVNGATQGNGGCALTCHTHVHVATVETWTFNGPPHPISFLGNQLDTQGNGHFTTTAATFASDCSLCHVYSGTSPSASAPACNVCHTKADPTQVSTGAGTCLSCHTGASFLTLGPDGNAFPSLAGKHAKHLSLDTPLDCSTCHNGVGAGTSTHYQGANARVSTPAGPAPVQIASTYNAQTGAAAFSPSALTCSTVSCHGGKATPSWQTGTLNSATQCGSCHAINGGALAAQFNDAVGRHAWGTHALAAAADCTLCHDMSTARHFAYLDTTAVSGVATGTPADQLPSATIAFKTNNATYPITGTRAYTISLSTPQGDGGCALACHSMTHVPASQHWDAPKGSAAHPVPFYNTSVTLSGNGHQTTTAALFAGDCIACHDESGTSYKSGPVCTTCHIKGSPLSAGMTAGTCLSCHVGSSFTTQGPGDTAWPSVKGAHLKHLSLLTFTRATPALPAGLTASAFPRCEACHVGSVPYDSAQTHYSNANRRAASPILTGPATVSIHSTFNAKSGTAGTTPSATNFTCSNVSCHGGQVTPGWQTGTLTVNANTWCLSCHKATNTTAAAATQYNDAYGRHGLPTDHKATCDHCHDMNAATNNKTGVINHFKYLDTTVVSGVSGTPADQYPSETIKFGTTVATPATGALTYTVTGSSGGITFTQGSGGCALTCHSLTHTPNPNYWTKP